MNIWMIVYRGQNGKWLLSIDFPVRAVSRRVAREYAAKFPGLLKDGSYRIVKFTAALKEPPCS